MKRKIILWLLALSLLTSCAAPAGESLGPSSPMETGSPAPTETVGSETGVTADAVARAIVASQPDKESYVARIGEAGGEAPDGDLAFYLELYGVDWDVVSDAAIYTVGGVDAREIAVLDLYRGSLNYDTASTAKALEEYRQNRLADFVGYAPEQAELVEQGQTAEGDGWVTLLICSDVPAAREALEVLAGTEPEPVPALASTSQPAPTLTPNPDARYKEDGRGYLPFLPPNEVDMTLYDTAAILAAWTAGDKSTLEEIDRRILERAEEVLAECVTEGMTDFEKELALHDWIVDNGHYDQTAHDPATPDGLPHSKDPYGILVEGYGICLGYATTFQLLMDLAGVECITVTGASGWSREDHAWNLVKLEGEWYGVDVTWDDQTLADPGAYSEEELSRRHHVYFNITSDELRSDNRQWDYDSVPEATAIRFRWDGAGTLPD